MKYDNHLTTGELRLLDYSDAAPDVSMSYDSRGRPQTISDGPGTRTLSYATGSKLLADSLTGVTRTYTDGRLTALSLGSDYGVSYGYDSYGRFGSISVQVAGTGTQTYTYGYMPNSDLLESLTSNHGLTVTRTYEPNRDVLTHGQNQFGANMISQYDYTNDELAQRTRRKTLTPVSTFATSLLEPLVHADTRCEREMVLV